MRSVAVFVEDIAHELVLKALIARLADHAGQAIDLIWRNTRGGHGAVVRELRQFLRDLRSGNQPLPDVIIVATDGNCKGYSRRRKEITDLTDRVSIRTICAIPDPHIERWLMIDAAAFKQVFGLRCAAPNQKCERNRYKCLLVEAIRAAGVSPSLGGMEFADELMAALDMDRAVTADPSLGHFVGDLRALFNEWGH